jgi:hypothetical protein
MPCRGEGEPVQVLGRAATRCREPSGQAWRRRETVVAKKLRMSGPPKPTRLSSRPSWNQCLPDKRGALSVLERRSRPI